MSYCTTATSVNVEQYIQANRYVNERKTEKSWLSVQLKPTVVASSKTRLSLACSSAIPASPSYGSLSAFGSASSGLKPPPTKFLTPAGCRPARHSRDTG